MNEQYSHLILVGSNYTTGERKGLHFLINESNTDEVFEKIFTMIDKEEAPRCSLYTINTSSTKIESVQEKDLFFKSMIISEGSNDKNALDFKKCITNQITVMDVAFLMLIRENMSLKKLRVVLLNTYCRYFQKYNRPPFSEKYRLSKDNLGFSSFNKCFSNVSEDEILRCKRPEIILSKIFNCDGGSKLMLDLLKIFYTVKGVNEKELEEKTNAFVERAINYAKKQSNVINLNKRIVERFYGPVDDVINIHESKSHKNSQ